MSWAAVVVTGANLAMGASAKKQSDKATEAMVAASREELQFAKDQYEDWKAVFGPVQENLAEHFNNLTPAYYESIGLESVAQAQAQTIAQVDAAMAARGTADSGIAASLTAQTASAVAQNEAQVRSNAPKQMMADQAGFLAAGEGANPTNSYQQALSNRTQYTTANAMQAGQAAGQTWAAAISSVGNLAGQYFSAPKPTVQPNVNVGTINLSPVGGT